MEILITLIILALSAFIIFKNIKNSSNGNCNCGSCSSHCAKYDLTKASEKNSNPIK